MESLSAVYAEEQVALLPYFISFGSAVILDSRPEAGVRDPVDFLLASILTLCIYQAGLILCKKCAGSGYSKRL